jgi:hypothetical protein
MSVLAEPDRLESSPPRQQAPSRLALAATVVLAATLAVFLIRLGATVAIGDCYDATCDGPPAYGVWKVQNGWPLYERADREPYSVTLYNYGFYHLYAAVLRLVGVGGSGIVLAGRLLTVLFGLVGCFLTYRLITCLSRPPGARGGRWLAACFAGFLWFGASSTSWFALSVRPDLLSLALATAGLLVYAGRHGSPGVGRCLAASLLFYLAWATKQSTVGILAGACVHAVLGERRVKAVVALALPCAGLMALTLALGGEDYRFNILKVPALSSLGLAPRSASEFPRARILVQSITTNTFVWLYPLLGPAVYLVARRLKARPAEDDPSPGIPSAVAVPALVASAWCVFAVFRDGSDKNTLLEAYLTTGALAGILLMRRMSAAVRPAAWLERAVVPWALLALAAYPAAQLVFFNRLGKLTPDNAAGHAQMVAFVDHMSRLPKPILIEDSQLSLPWYTTDNRYPAYTLDVYLMVDAKSKGFYGDGGLEKLVRQRAFGCLLLKHGLIVPAVAREAGYEPAAFPPGVDSRGFELYLLPDAADDAPRHAMK